jgi:hypothetical protein
MTITQPTGQLLTDLALFAVFFAFAFAVVIIGTELEIRKGKRK